MASKQTRYDIAGCIMKISNNQIAAVNEMDIILPKHYESHPLLRNIQLVEQQYSTNKWTKNNEDQMVITKNGQHWNERSL